MKRQNATIFAALVAAFVLSAGTAEASRFFLSTTSTSPALINPTINMLVGQSAKLYVFWQPTIDEATLDYEQLSGWSHDLRSSNTTIIKATSYFILNPTSGGSPRWGSANPDSPTTFLINDANAVKLGGSNLGFFTTSNQGYFNVGGTDVWRLSTVTFTANNVGQTLIRQQVGAQGIAFTPSPAARTINFGFDDAGISSSSFNTGTTIADATVNVVPEPGTLGLAWIGGAGFLLWARRRKASA